MEAPTQEQLFDEDGVNPVHSSNSHWRHGTYESVIFHRPADNSYWCAAFRLSTDGETNELREGTARVSRVMPEQRTVTVYVPFKIPADDGAAPAKV